MWISMRVGDTVEVIKLNNDKKAPYYKHTIGKVGIIREIDEDGSIGVDFRNVPYSRSTWFDYDELKVIQ